MESRKTTTMCTRRRCLPLHTCGVSIMTIKHKVSKMVQDYNKPIGTIMIKAATLATSTSLFIYIAHFQWLAILFFIDNHIILAIEHKIETLFPKSSYLFDKFDELLFIIERLPETLDQSANKVPEMIKQIPILEWALCYVISWLTYFAQIFISSGSSSTREKDIMIDLRCNNCGNESATFENSPKSDTKVSPPSTPTYKDILLQQKGTKVELVKNDEDNKSESKETKEDNKSESKETKEATAGRKVEADEKTAVKKVANDPILELFESAWH